MPIKTVELPSGAQVEAVYFGGINSCASYLHYKRYHLHSPDRKKAQENLYNFNCKHKIIPELLNLLKTLKDQPFTLVVVPSSGSDADIYREHVLCCFKHRDISERFSKALHYKASENAVHPKRTLEAINYNSDGTEKQIERLVILDDVVATGGTIDAVITRLHQAGTPDNTHITVVTPLII